LSPVFNLDFQFRSVKFKKRVESDENPKNPKQPNLIKIQIRKTLLKNGIAQIFCLKGERIHSKYNQ